MANGTAIFDGSVDDILNKSQDIVTEWPEDLGSLNNNKVLGAKFAILKKPGKVITYNINNESTTGEIFNDLTHNSVSGNYSHAEGSYTIASGSGAHAEGEGTATDRNTASGGRSHAEGRKTIASGSNSHAENYETIAEGDSSHAEGSQTKAYNKGSHAEGMQTIAGYEGEINLDSAAHAEGQLTEAYGLGSHAEGKSNKSNAINIIINAQNSTEGGGGGGISPSPTPNNNLYEDIPTIGTHTEGQQNYATGAGAHAEGQNNVAIGGSNHVEGYYCIAGLQGVGNKLINGGYDLETEGLTIESTSTILNKEQCHAEGYKTIANGSAAHAEGIETYAGGMGSHAEGHNTQAIAKYSHAAGEGTITYMDWQTVIGRYNKKLESTSTERPFFVIGDGTDNNTRKDIFRVGVDSSGDKEPYIMLGETKITKGQLERLLDLI